MPSRVRSQGSRPRAVSCSYSRPPCRIRPRWISWPLLCANAEYMGRADMDDFDWGLAGGNVASVPTDATIERLPERRDWHEFTPAEIERLVIFRKAYRAHFYSDDCRTLDSGARISSSTDSQAWLQP